MAKKRKKKRRQKKHPFDFSVLLLVCAFVVGISLLLYPKLSDLLNRHYQSKAIASYTQQLDLDNHDRYAEIWQAAVEYNQELFANPISYTLSEEKYAEYESLLRVSETGIMGYVEIPEIDCTLPIYHGTDETVLQTAAGHLEWTSLPTGGENTHCVISGHRGLPSAELFTDLDKLKEGDLFTLQILDRSLTYEVDQILVVEPYETEALQIAEGKDYCTLMTCTPYGINTHRLLVRGHRVTEPVDEAAGKPSNAIEQFGESRES